MADEISSLFLRVRELPLGERARFLDDACRTRPELRREVESLLSHDLDGARWMSDRELSRMMGELASAVLGEGEPGLVRRQLGRYPILGVLGRGGMGIVYRSQQESPRRPVALKVLRSELLTPAGSKRFQREVEILGRLRHPGLAQIYEAGTCETELGPLPFLAMELVEGQPLLEHCAGLDVEQKLERIAAIADAIDHAHRHGVVHRDLKPSNVLVEPSGQVKVLDFGIARDFQQTTTLTLSGQLVGTLPYMSPEQLADEEEVDARADVYALGVCLYQVLTGRLPHQLEGRSLGEALRILSRGALPPVAPGLGRDLETIVHTALAPERERRYASAAELAQDLRRFLRDEPIRARPVSVLHRLRRGIRRHRAAAAVTCTVVLALVLFWSARQTVQAQADQLRVVEAGQVLQALRQRAAALWPHAAADTELESWLRDGEVLAAELPRFERALEGLRARTQSAGAAWTFAEEGEQRAHDQLSRLVRELAVFADPDPARGLLAEVRERARHVEARTVEIAGAHVPEWKACVESVARSPRYGGLVLEPQAGLVPLRADPSSGLWEFWHTPSGARPELDAGSGRWRIRLESGLVLVLIPAGKFLMGAQNLAETKPNWDFNCRDDTLPVHEVSLKQFFLSKYEMTQAQFERLTGSNPSFWKHEAEPAFGVHPVEQVSSGDCWPTLPVEWGLGFPTEAQWEYAARAGTTLAWFGGSPIDDLALYANLKDQSYGRELDSDDVFVSWDDTYPDHAPVGSFEPNAFGLHDTFGNVLEWCADLYGSYELPVYPESGGRIVSELEPGESVLRGGSYQSNFSQVTPSVRIHKPPDFRAPTLGLRPARRVGGL